MSLNFRDVPIEASQDLVLSIAAYFGHPTFPAAPVADQGHHIGYKPVGDEGGVGILKTYHVQITWNTSDSNPEWYGVIADLAAFLAVNTDDDFPRRVDIVVKHSYEDPKDGTTLLQSVIGGKVVQAKDIDRKPLDKFAVLIGVYDTRPANTLPEAA